MRWAVWASTAILSSSTAKRCCSISLRMAYCLMRLPCPAMDGANCFLMDAICSGLSCSPSVSVCVLSMTWSTARTHCTTTPMSAPTSWPVPLVAGCSLERCFQSSSRRRWSSAARLATSSAESLASSTSPCSRSRHLCRSSGRTSWAITASSRSMASLEAHLVMSSCRARCRSSEFASLRKSSPCTLSTWDLRRGMAACASATRERRLAMSAWTIECLPSTSSRNVITCAAVLAMALARPLRSPASA
mmetsp:Transcript_12114/g.35830  ORF Transcript_12114/g.35830 Transcript_12114/m.35830 type:complete len:247 (-) Transcript_12114:1937-2677(-)